MEAGRAQKNMYFWKTEANYFFGEGWTGEIRLELLMKIGFWRERRLRLHTICPGNSSDCCFAATVDAAAFALHGRFQDLKDDQRSIIGTEASAFHSCYQPHDRTKRLAQLSAGKSNNLHSRSRQSSQMAICLIP
jgi:hypothetical protein